MLRKFLNLFKVTSETTLVNNVPVEVDPTWPSYKFFYATKDVSKTIKTFTFGRWAICHWLHSETTVTYHNIR